MDRETRERQAGRDWLLDRRLRELREQAERDIAELGEKIQALGPGHCRNCGTYLFDDDYCPECGVGR